MERRGKARKLAEEHGQVTRIVVGPDRPDRPDRPDGPDGQMHKCTTDKGCFSREKRIPGRLKMNLAARLDLL